MERKNARSGRKRREAQRRVREEMNERIRGKGRIGQEGREQKQDDGWNKRKEQDEKNMKNSR
jgi:hypothetical protein